MRAIIAAMAAQVLLLTAGCDAEYKAVDLDEDGFSIEDGDCNEGDAAINPGASEIWYDGIDQNCDGNDADQDGDGFLAVEGGGEDCWDDPSSTPEAYATVSGVTALSAVEVNPEAGDVWYDGADQDCGGEDDFDQDGDGYRSAFHEDHDGQLGDDCADGSELDSYTDEEDIKRYLDGVAPTLADLGLTVADVNPGADDTCLDGINQDCNAYSDWDCDEDTYNFDDECDDTDPDVFPNDAPDPWYDCQDSNCDGNDGDQDGDGYVPDDYAATCDWEQFTGHTEGTGDCWDDPAEAVSVTLNPEDVNPGATETWYDDVDQDCDGGSDYDQDGDGYDSGAVLVDGEDCDDLEASINPGANEICDEFDVDEDCSDSTNDVGAIGCTNFNADNDGDGYGTSVTQCYCEPSGIYTASNDDDCLDSGSMPGVDGSTVLASAIYPGATETPGDEVDQDCDNTELCYTDADDDGYRPNATATTASSDLSCQESGEADATEPIGDCDDTLDHVNPAGFEVCDDDDNDEDCSGAADNDDTAMDYDSRRLYYIDADGDLFGDIDHAGELLCDPTTAYPVLENNEDCDDTRAFVNPDGTEVCDTIAGGLDEDCDGLVDNDDDSTTDASKDLYYPDVDNDSFGDADDPGELFCDPTATYEVLDNTDCDDTDFDINTDATEIAGDEVDQDCDTNEICYTDADDDGYRPDASSTVSSSDVDCDDSGEADDTQPTTDCDDSDFDINPSVAEIAGDEVDQDCDDTEVCYTDADDDGFRPDASSTTASADLDCDDSGEALDSEPTTDCDDSDFDINPSVAEITGDEVDQDCDTNEECYVDADDDGYRLIATVTSSDIDCQDSGEATSDEPIGECDDTDEDINPAATEIAGDEVDQDCDSAEICYVDDDDDGYRPDASSTVSSSDVDCTDSGEALDSDPTTDCDDSDFDINPGVSEIAGDEIDQDCDNTELCYTDADNDGYRPNASATTASADVDCDDSGEAVSSEPTTDCDDSDTDINPAATEIAGDEVDQDCTGTETCYTDADNDGYRPNSTATTASADTDCSDSGEALDSEPTTDCDDSDFDINPGVSEIAGDEIDQNCDTNETCYTDADNDGYRPNSTSTVSSSDVDCDDSGEATSGEPTTDCDDTDEDINPAAIEIAGDEVDQDCTGTETCYTDADNDGYRPNSTSTVSSCDVDCDDSGEATSGEPTTDCDDTDTTINPGASEIAGDEVDQDCDNTEVCYTDADNDGYRPNSSATTASADTDCGDSGEALDSEPTTDCDDTDTAINPGASEIAGDEVDQNCDTNERCYVDVDDDGFRPDSTSTVSSSDVDCTDSGEALSSEPTTDCDDSDFDINPDATEIAGDEVDQDCDTNEVCYVDADNDGYRPDGISTVSSSDVDCDDSGEAVTGAPTTDCDDSDPDINPGESEIVGDEIDQDCDDEEVCYADDDNDGFRPDAAATTTSADTDCDDFGEAVDVDPITDCDDTDAAINPDATEIAGDEVDQNCDTNERCYVDDDDDGFRPDGTSTVSSSDVDCTDSGEALDSDPITDCDDLDFDINPDATEIVADGVDQDCDDEEICYTDADDDGYRPDSSSTTTSSDEDCGDAFEAIGTDPTTDCDDDDATANPGETEIVGNGTDEDCDGFDADFNVTDLAYGDLVFTEVMVNPAAVADNVGEWFELYNNFGNSIDLLGLEINDNAGSFTVDVNLVATAGQHIVFVRNDTGNGGITVVDFEYGTVLSLGNGSSERLEASYDGLVIDDIDFGTSSDFPGGAGVAMGLDDSFLDAADENDVGYRWCDAVTAYGDGDLGTPGSANDDCGFDAASSADVQALLDVECAGCHIGGGSSGGMTLDDVNDAVGTASNDIPAMNRIEPADPDDSYIWLKLNNTHIAAGGDGDQMPKGGGAPLDTADLDLIEDWILQGAPE